MSWWKPYENLEQDDDAICNVAKRFCQNHPIVETDEGRSCVCFNYPYLGNNVLSGVRPILI